MRAHYLQHVPFEGLGSIEAWLRARGATLTGTRLFLGEPLPDAGHIDFLVAMGGPMSVNDEIELPWLRSEKQFIRNEIARGTAVLGICLGAQLIASALGASVYPNRVKEIGWFPIQALPTPAGAFKFPAHCSVFHWHGETFDLPVGALPLARSPACENQAFQWKQNVIGLQFHLETTPESAIALIENCQDDLTPGPFVQSAAELRAAPVESYTAINSLMSEVLTYMLRDTL
jgi:GMP synthase-like glutamine amidotransferase